MKRENVFAKVVLFVFVSLGLILGGHYWYKSGEAERTYTKETAKLRLIREHQGLQLEVMRINAEIERLKEEAEKDVPVYELSPRAQ